MEREHLYAIESVEDIVRKGELLTIEPGRPGILAQRWIEWRDLPRLLPYRYRSLIPYSPPPRSLPEAGEAGRHRPSLPKHPGLELLK